MKKTTGELIGEHIKTNKENKIILGIDPGLHFLGIGIIEIDPEIINTIETNKKNKINPISLIPIITNHTHLFLKLKTKRETTEKLFFIYEQINQIIERYSPNLIIVEDSFVGLNKNSAIKLGLARGSILTAIGKNKGKVEIIAPKQIKLEVTQKGNAEKQEIESFFKNNLENWKNSEKFDSTDALAAAFCGIKFFV
ncbi:crossover junction endodeoxyribonuclease RuvC [Alphaproteobacteria bacterium endosymbiont of Tiliacea citrago]|uniref:crossover junction endodeoxyribonuclease RuvC n=1 Tax=Alphaproteobacteria bacterium endosymbiont of Tiliacea citrago TaxID=3077944 RepID=UPI00313EDC3F